MDDQVDFEVQARISEALYSLKQNKPNDRSEKDRRYAIAITEVEKVYAYFDHYVTHYVERNLKPVKE